MPQLDKYNPTFKQAHKSLIQQDFCWQYVMREIFNTIPRLIYSPVIYSKINCKDDENNQLISLKWAGEATLYIFV